MKKDDVKLGECYLAKVTDRVVPVRIDAAKGTGWSATNLATGKTVYIKTAQRLRRKCTQADLAGFRQPTAKQPKETADTPPTSATVAKPEPKASKEAKPQPTATPADKRVGAAKPAAKPKAAASEKPKAAKKAASKPRASATKPMAKPKKISGLTAAFMVLVDVNKELGVKEIVHIAAEKGWWKSEAKTPAATVYAAIIREIAAKGDKSRFRRGKARGTFRAICSAEQRRELLGKAA